MGTHAQLLITTRFTHSLLTHDHSVLVDLATRVVAHFLRLVILETSKKSVLGYGQSFHAITILFLNHIQRIMSTSFPKLCSQRSIGWAWLSYRKRRLHCFAGAM